MLHEFLEANRVELVERCRAKVARRPAPRASAHEMEHGIPVFLDQLIETLRARRPAVATAEDAYIESIGVTARHVRSEITAGATRHGRELLHHGFTVDQVVHDYGDLCQAVTELAIEKDAAVSVDEFQTLNRCLDDAIADAVTEFGWQRDQVISEISNRALSERLGNLAHELRNFLNTALLSFEAIKRGGVGLDGATAAVLDRSLRSLGDLVDSAMTEVRLDSALTPHLDSVALDRFLEELRVSAGLEAKARECEFVVGAVAPGLKVRVDRALLHSAVSNLLQNAFKFTRLRSQVSLTARSKDDRVLIEVEDRCGGLPPGTAEKMFAPFEQHHSDRSGVGLGLSISRRAVEASGGTLSVRDIPGTGCVFSIDLPRFAGPPEAAAVRAGLAAIAAAARKNP